LKLRLGQTSGPTGTKSCQCSMSVSSSAAHM
jgi:hypothetical protein